MFCSELIISDPPTFAGSVHDVARQPMQGMRWSDIASGVISIVCVVWEFGNSSGSAVFTSLLCSQASRRRQQRSCQTLSLHIL